MIMVAIGNLAGTSARRGAHAAGGWLALVPITFLRSLTTFRACPVAALEGFAEDNEISRLM